MTVLQEKLLDILKWFDSFCRENDLQYFLLGGSMLGAARHKGFIPWDDDIDVGMPREDYERLALLLKDKKGKYMLETPDTEAKDYFYPFSKIYDTSTTLIENTKHKIKRGIYLDVFALDGIGNSPEESKKNYKKISFYYNLLLTRAGGVRSGRSFYKNLSVILMRIIPECALNTKGILKRLMLLCKEHSYKDCLWVGNLMGAWRLKELVPKEVIGEPIDYEFEGMTVKGVADADRYLTYLYGNWRAFPPKEKQVSHHDYIKLELDRSYLE